MTTLRECPFCTCPRVFVHDDEIDDATVVTCPKCSMHGPMAEWGETASAMSAWNTRPLEDALRDALERIEQWAAAYPVTVFRPVSPDQMHHAGRILSAHGISMDAMHAEWARHILDGVREIVRAALAGDTDDNV